MRLRLVVLALLVAGALAHAGHDHGHHGHDHGEDHDPTEKIPGVVDITPDTVDAVVTGAKGVLLELYAPWCGHCKQLAPVMKALAAALKADADLGSRFVLAKGDADAHRALGETFGVRGFPTLKFVARGKRADGAEDYRGGRTVEDFLEFLRTRAAAAKDAVDVDALAPAAQKLLGATGAGDELRGAADEARAAVDAIASDDAYKGKMPAAGAHAALLARAADKAQGAKKRAGDAARKWMQGERDRLERVLATGSVSAAKLEDMALRADVLTAILAKAKAKK